MQPSDDEPCRNHFLPQAAAGTPGVPLHGHTANVVGDTMVIIGGLQADSDFSHNTWLYNFTTEQWRKGRRSVESARYKHASAAVGDVVFVHGGHGKGTTLHEDLWRLLVRPATTTWSLLVMLGDRISARAGHTGTAFDGVVYLFGGWTPDRGLMNDLYSFDPATSFCRQLSTVSAPMTAQGCQVSHRAEAAVVEDAGVLWVLGGTVVTGNEPDNWGCLLAGWDVAAGEWVVREMESCSIAQQLAQDMFCGYACVVRDRHAYIVGSSEDAKEVLMLDLAGGVYHRLSTRDHGEPPLLGTTAVAHPKGVCRYGGRAVTSGAVYGVVCVVDVTSYDLRQARAPHADNACFVERLDATAVCVVFVAAAVYATTRTTLMRRRWHKANVIVRQRISNYVNNFASLTELYPQYSQELDLMGGTANVRSDTVLYHKAVAAHTSRSPYAYCSLVLDTALKKGAPHTQTPTPPKAEKPKKRRCLQGVQDPVFQGCVRRADEGQRATTGAARSRRPGAAAVGVLSAEALQRGAETGETEGRARQLEQENVCRRFDTASRPEDVVAYFARMRAATKMHRCVTAPSKKTPYLHVSGLAEVAALHDYDDPLVTRASTRVCGIPWRNR